VAAAAAAGIVGYDMFWKTEDEDLERLNSSSRSSSFRVMSLWPVPCQCKDTAFLLLKLLVVLHCSDLVVVHEALGFGHCHLALGVPMGGKYANVTNLEQLRAMEWTEEQPLRVVTGVSYNTVTSTIESR
jgi:hypothetical protein